MKQLKSNYFLRIDTPKAQNKLYKQNSNNSRNPSNSQDKSTSNFYKQMKKSFLDPIRQHSENQKSNNITNQIKCRQYRLISKDGPSQSPLNSNQRMQHQILNKVQSEQNQKKDKSILSKFKSDEFFRMDRKERSPKRFLSNDQGDQSAIIRKIDPPEGLIHRINRAYSNQDKANQNSLLKFRIKNMGQDFKSPEPVKNQNVQFFSNKESKKKNRFDDSREILYSMQRKQNNESIQQFNTLKKKTINQNDYNKMIHHRDSPYFTEQKNRNQNQDVKQKEQGNQDQTVLTWITQDIHDQNKQSGKEIENELNLSNFRQSEILGNKDSNTFIDEEIKETFQKIKKSSEIAETTKKMHNNRILDFLLLNTSELQKILSKEQKASKIRIPQQKKGFPQDFFSILRKK